MVRVQMSDGQAHSPQQLFKQWQNGDAEAGQAMASMVTDWYYAITAVRLGDRRGREPLERACANFAGGITAVSRAGELVDWAHGVVQRELEAAGLRTEGGDFPNALTGHRSPTELLQRARTALQPEQVELLHLAFDPRVNLQRLVDAAEARGGWPLALLDARYALKRRLRQNEGVNFSVAPTDPDLDRAPMPLYEAARMASPEEERVFEQWLLSDLDLCRDVAEFATFAHALRAGAFSPRAAAAITPPKVAGPGPAPAPRPAVAPPVAPPPPHEPLAEKPPAKMVAGAVAVVLVILAAILAFILYYAL